MFVREFLPRRAVAGLARYPVVHEPCAVYRVRPADLDRDGAAAYGRPFASRADAEPVPVVPAPAGLNAKEPT